MRRYLRANGIDGSARVGDGGRTLTVTVSLTRPTVFPGLVGVTAVTVRGSARARLVRGITTEEPT